MSEYISKERARSAIRTVWSESEGDAGLLDYQAAIENEPPADVKPVVRGEWVSVGEFEQCSACKATRLKRFQTAYCEAIWIKSDFCPNCGADIRPRKESGE